MLAIGSIVMKVHDVPRAAAFCCAALDYVPLRPDGLGAERVEWPNPDRTHDYTVLADPDGNRYCVIDTVAE